MKKLLQLFLFILFSCIGVSAGTWTWDGSNVFGVKLNGYNLPKSGTYTISGKSWAVSVAAEGSEEKVYINNDKTKGLQFGAKKGNPSELKFVSNDFSAKITSIKVNTSTVSKGNPVLSVSVNGVEYKISAGATSYNVTSSATDVTFTTDEPQVGEVVILWSQPSPGVDDSKSIYTKGFTVAYEDEDQPIKETCAEVTFSPAGGTYTEAQNVTLSSATDGAAIYYTTNGDNPTTASTKYSEAINIAKSTTIKALAVKDGFNDSPVATAVYQIENGETPSFEGGDCEIVFANQGWSVAPYNKNSKEKTWKSENGVEFATTFSFNGSGTVYPAWNNPNLRLYYSNKNQIEISAPDGYYITKVSGINNACIIDGATLAAKGTHTFDKQESSFMWRPSTSGKNTDYSGMTITLAKIGGTPVPDKPAAPVFTPAGGEFDEAQTITLSCVTEDAVIKYSIDGGKTWLDYVTTGIEVGETMTIQAKAVLAEIESDVVESKYIINIPVITKMSAPTFHPEGVTSFSESLEVYLISDDADASVWYAIEDGDFQLYSGKIVITETTTISAKATKDGLEDSDVVTRTFTKQEAVEGLIFKETFTGSTGFKVGNPSWADASNTQGVARYDNEGWNDTDYVYGCEDCVRIGKRGQRGSIETPALSKIVGSMNLVMTFDAAPWHNENESIKVLVSVLGPGSVNTSEIVLQRDQWTTYNVLITGATAETKVRLTSKEGAMNRFFLDNVEIYASSFDESIDFDMELVDNKVVMTPRENHHFIAWRLRHAEDVVESSMMRVEANSRWTNHHTAGEPVEHEIDATAKYYIDAKAVSDRGGESREKTVLLDKGTVTGVSDVAVDAAEVEFFNLQGVRVTNPENGVYIRRQGSTVTKVYVR